MYLPKISIVTPSFNQEEYIEETILSVINQNYPNLEYVIIDGGSTDKSVNIIKKYEDYLHYWVSENDLGHGDAINKGFSKTSGEIMAWINSDDKYTPWCLRTVAEIFSKFPHVKWIVGFNSWWNSRGAMIGARRGQINIYDYLLGRYEWIQQESVFWRRDLWDEAGGYINQNYKLIVDGELWSRFFLYEPLYSVDCILGGWRTHSNNRAKRNCEERRMEMEHAISTMKSHCHVDILSTHKNIMRLIKRRNIPLLKWLFPNLTNLSYKNIHSIKRSDYRIITWKNEKWIEERINFLF